LTSPFAVSLFLERLANSPTRDWLRPRDAADGTGPLLVSAFTEVQAAVDALGLPTEAGAIEDRIDALVRGVQWFAEQSEGVHGITARDISGLKLLALCALALLTREHLSPHAFDVLVTPFREMLA
jgi:hypothetical protein